MRYAGVHRTSCVVLDGRLIARSFTLECLRLSDHDGGGSTRRVCVSSSLGEHGSPLFSPIDELFNFISQVLWCPGTVEFNRCSSTQERFNRFHIVPNFSLFRH